MSAIRLAVDFDGLQTNIYLSYNGVVLSEPTVAVVSKDGDGEIVAIGNDAKKLIGKTAENDKVIFPIFEGEIVNERVATKILSYFLKKIEYKHTVFNNEAIFAVPCGLDINELEKYRTVAKNVGINKVDFIESPVLSAFGQKIPLNSSPVMVVDMAGNMTNIAVLNSNNVISGLSVNVGDGKITTELIDDIVDVYGIKIGYLTAEKLKKDIGSLKEDDGLMTVINGKDVKTGEIKSVVVKAIDIIDFVKKYYEKVAEIVLKFINKLPPEISVEVINKGIYFSGCAAEIYGLSSFLEKKLNCKINVDKNGKYSVILGAGALLNDKSNLKKYRLNLD